MPFPSTIASPSSAIQSIVGLFLRHRPNSQRLEAERIQADATGKTGKDIILPSHCRVSGILSVTPSVCV